MNWLFNNYAFRRLMLGMSVLVFSAAMSGLVSPVPQKVSDFFGRATKGITAPAPKQQGLKEKSKATRSVPGLANFRNVLGLGR